MRAYIIIHDPIPAHIDLTFGTPQFGRFGYGAWRYGTNNPLLAAAYGEVEWINFTEFVTEPKYDNPLSFDFQLKEGILFTPTWDLNIKSHAAEIILNGIKVNPATGKGFPWSVGPG